MFKLQAWTARLELDQILAAVHCHQRNANRLPISYEDNEDMLEIHSQTDTRARLAS